jgi:hypothetical protein
MEVAGCGVGRTIALDRQVDQRRAMPNAIAMYQTRS